MTATSPALAEKQVGWESTVSKRHIVDVEGAPASPSRTGGAVVFAHEIYRRRVLRELEEVERELEAAIRRATGRLERKK
jgi:hypothetical protein